MRIEDYALIGDCETAALVGRDGSIDWLCWPRFDSEACFSALLGSHDHGHWLICPKHSGARVVRRYRPNTLILETRFETPEGAATLIDFMPPRGRHSNIVRMVVGERGRVPMATKLVFRFGYGAIVPWMTRLEDGTYRAIAGPDMVVLRTPVQLRGENLTTVGNFVISAGETIPFVLTYSLSHLPPPAPRDPTTALEATEAFWRDWTGKCTAEGPWHEAVMRSLITLKALTYAPTGGIVAAATTSLPEHPGGPRNWDYRFCCTPASTTRLRRGATGWCGPSLAAPIKSSRCTASAASATCTNGSYRGYRVLRTPSRSGSGTQRTASFNLTCSVRSLMPFTRRVAAASPRASQDGGCR
jgi:GH15 family glucan-1,4-alpha-glucosidase